MSRVFGDECRLTLGLLLFAAFACLAGCGSSGIATTRFLVMDQGNHRVLIYTAPFTNGQSADVVLGQASFTASAVALTATGMSDPAGTAEDGSGNIYVSDDVYNRVLQFKPPFSIGMSASLVIGQPDFTTGTPNTTQNGFGGENGSFCLGGPRGLAFDGSGNLWVADFGNSRILQFKPPFANHMNASLVLGHADFTSSCVGATTSSGLEGPNYIAFDAGGNLWVTDGPNNRCLEFKPPFANGMTASVVVGQTDFVSGTALPPPTASSLLFPTGVAFDSSGNLWIVDGGNNRVLQFKPPFTNGMTASLVLGQASFTASTAATTQNGFSAPWGLGFDSGGNLRVADLANNRTLGFQPPFSNNQNANLVLGQANFTTSTAATTASDQTFPIAVFAVF